MNGRTEVDDWIIPGAAAGADDWIAPSAAPTSERPSAFGRAARFVDNIGRGLARGATLGFADEIAAGINTGFGFLGDYGAALEAERARDREFDRGHPWFSLGARAVGGGALPLNRVMQGATLLGTMGRGAAVGAGMGAAAGFGEGEGLENRLQQAQTGLAIGGGVGAVAPAVIAGGGALIRRGRDAASRAVGREPTATAERMVLRDLARDGVAPEELARRSAAAGTNPAMVADLAGENVLQSAQTIARQPGPGREMAARELAARGGAAQAGRLSGRVREFLGAQNYREAADELVTQRAVRAQPAYERAWRIQLTPDEYQRVAPFVQDRIGQDAMQRGLRVIELESLAARRQFNPADYGVQRGPNGWVPMEGRAPNMRLMDAVKRGYDAIVEDFRDQFGRLRLNEYGRAVNSVRAEYRNTLAGMFPPYRRALETWSGPSATLEAMSVGRRLLNEGADAAEMTAAQIRRMAPGDREAFRLGVARGMLDRIERATDAQDLTRMNQIFGTPAIRQRLRAAFDSEADFRRFAGEMQRELGMARTNAAIAPRGGSPTMPMQERAADLRSPPSGPIMQGMLRDGAEQQPNLLREIAQGESVMGTPNMLLRRYLRGRDEAAYRRNAAAMAPYLFTTDPAARQRAADALVARQLADETTRRLTGRAVPAATRGAVVGAGGLVRE